MMILAGVFGFHFCCMTKGGPIGIGDACVSAMLIPLVCIIRYSVSRTMLLRIFCSFIEE